MVPSLAALHEILVDASLEMEMAAGSVMLALPVAVHPPVVPLASVTLTL